MAQRVMAMMATVGWLVACGGSSPFTLTLELVNPSQRTFEGSGGAHGLGVSYRVEGLENGRDLVVDRECQGRTCGEPAVVEPGVCGVDPDVVQPGTAVPVDWNGMYFPRGHDPWGECLEQGRAVPQRQVQVTVCGRLTGRDVRMAPLRCDSRTVDPSNQAEPLIFEVPGVTGME